MRPYQVYKVVFKKEFRELLRDRRSLFWLFAPPIVLPAIAICAGIFIGSQALRIVQEGFPIIIQNSNQAPDLVERLEAENSIRVVEAPPPEAQNPFGEAILIVAIPPDFTQQLAENDTVAIHLLTRDDSILSFLGKNSLRALIHQYSQQVLEDRLAAQGLSSAWLQPVTVGEQRVSSNRDMMAVASGEELPKENGTSILATIFLPLAVTSWLLGGGMGLVLDTTVGEKDRQTIENLLVTPASRVGIVMGKMSVVFIASIMVMGLWLLEGLLLNAFSLAGPELAQAQDLSFIGALEIIFTRGNGVLGLVAALLLLILPFTLLLNALVMSWCAYASNYREANLFMALVQLGLPASVLLTIFSLPPDVAEWVYGVPFFGTIVAIRDLFSNALSTEGLIINMVLGSVYAMGGIGLAAWIFGREWSLTRGLQ